MSRILSFVLFAQAWLYTNSTAAIPLTLLVEFSAEHAQANQLSMRHWSLLEQAAGDRLQVSVEHVSLQRSLELVQKSGYCVFSKRKTSEREAVLIFSQKPLSVSPSQRFIQLQPTSLTHPLPSEINLRYLLQSTPKMKIGIAAGRTYGTSVDSLIKEFPQQFYGVSGEDVPLKLWQMLQRGRVDAVIDYKARIELLQMQHSAATPAKPISVIPLTDQPMLVEGFVACNKLPHGVAVMALIDHLMAEPSFQQHLVESFRQYFSAAEWQEVQSELQRYYPAWQPH